MKKWSGLFFFVLLAFLQSCNQEVTDVEDALETSGVGAKSFEVSLDDVATAIGSYFTIKSRSCNYTVSIVKDDSGVPAFYVVNFENNEGFVLLSANKKAWPILAHADTGQFDIENPDNPTSVWMEDAIHFVQACRVESPESVRASMYQWQKMLYKSSIDKIARKKHTPKSRSDISQAEYQRLQKIVMDARNEWEVQGYKTYGIEQVLENDEEWNAYIRQRVEEAIYPLYTDYCDAFSFIVEFDEEEINEKNIIIETKWHQDYPYNAYCYQDADPSQHALVGCGPLAAGQIMYYYEYPNKFDWQEMKEFGYARYDAIAGMLRQVGVDCKAKYKKTETTVYTNDVASALRHYGYEASVKTTPPNKLPYIMSASYVNDANIIKGHIWIAGGRGTYLSHHYYVCWCMTEYDRMTDIEQSPDYGISYSDTYYVWGWGGNYDGWYYSLDVHPKYKNPLTNKKYIEINCPQ